MLNAECRERDKGMRKRLTIVLACGALGAMVGAQSRDPAQPTFRAEVNLVEVAAVVTGEDGRSLDDLAASDFELLEDGAPRALLSVRRLASDTRESATPERLPAAAPNAHVERLATSVASADAPAFVLLLDDLDTSLRNSHRVIRAAERALSYIPETALVSVVTTSGIGGSLLTLERPGPAHIRQIRSFRGQLLLRPRSPGGAATTPSSVSAPCGVGSHVLDSLDCSDPTRAARRASSVAAAAEILGRAGSRRKVLLWVTQTMGVSSIDPHGSRIAQRRALAAALGNDVTVFVLDPRENTGGAEDPVDEKRSGGKLRAGTADTALGGPGAMVMDLDVDDMAAVPLTQLTRETGGRYITMANDLGDLMGRLIEQNSTAYLLVYESPVSKTPGRHRIAVRVNRPGARVSARRGYIVEPAAADTPAALDAGDDLLRRTLFGSAPQGQLRLTVHAVPRLAEGRRGAVSVAVLAEGLDGPLEMPLDVVLATFDDEGQAANQRQLRLEPSPDGRPLEFVLELPVARGRHQLRVAAVTADGGRTALVIAPIEVIEPGRSLVMAPPVLLQRTGEQVGPTAARRFAAGAPLGVQAEVAGRAVRDRQVTVRITLVDEAGAAARTTDAVFDPGTRPDRMRATGLIGTTGLAAGRYLLTIEAVPPKAANAVAHAVPIRIASD